MSKRRGLPEIFAHASRLALRRAARPCGRAPGRAPHSHSPHRGESRSAAQRDGRPRRAHEVDRRQGRPRADPRAAPRRRALHDHLGRAPLPRVPSTRVSRRFRASRWTCPDNELLEIALIENLQRKDLSPFEEAEGYKALQERHGYTHEQIADAVGKSRVTITEALSIATASGSRAGGMSARRHRVAVVPARARKAEGRRPHARRGEGDGERRDR